MLKKDLGLPKPWSDNDTFQRTYFCNVRREHDRVTRFIRETYSPWVRDSFFEFNIILSRFLNWPHTLRRIGYIEHYNPEVLEATLDDLSREGKIWGGAYIITTHGIPMGKVQYLCRNVLEGVSKAMGGGSLPLALRPPASLPPSCRAAHTALQSLEGLGSFLAAQVVADLKNTPGHPLYEAFDRTTFVAHGPGSIRGLSWFNDGATITPNNFMQGFVRCRDYVDYYWNPTLMGVPIDDQDLQNCLCEFDKMMRVMTGSGKSKRNYPGI